MSMHNGIFVPSVLWCCWLTGRKGIQPVKNWVVGCWHGCLGWGADLHIAKQMPLPLTISCSSKCTLVLPFLVLPFWYLLTRVVPDKFQKSSKTICACVCMCIMEYFIKTTTTTTSILRLSGLCLGQPGWAGTKRNTHHLHLSWLSIIPYLLPPSLTIHGILLV